MEVKAAVVHGVNQPFKIETLELREPVKNEVLVKFVATGLCHTDLSVVEGHYPFSFPALLGHEGAGIVIGCGPDVEHLKVGDHVVASTVPNCGKCVGCQRNDTNFCAELYPMLASSETPFSLNGVPVQRFCGLGTFADHSVIREDQLAKIRDDASLEYASLLGCGVATGVGSALYTAKVSKGSTAIVIGAGGVGLSAIQGCKIAGARRIIAVDINPSKESAACRFGATEFVDASKFGTDELVPHLLELTQGGADFVLECVGAPALQSLAFAVTHVGWGVCSMVGFSAGEFSVPGRAFLSGRTVNGSANGDIKGRTGLPALADWYVEGKIDLEDLVSHTLTLDDINEGYDLMRSGKSLRSIILF